MQQLQLELITLAPGRKIGQQLDCTAVATNGIAKREDLGGVLSRDRVVADRPLRGLGAVVLLGQGGRHGPPVTAREQLDGLRDPAVQQRPQRRGRQLVCRLAQQVVGEVVCRTLVAPDDPASPQLVDCVDDDVLGIVARLGEQPERECAA